MQYRPYKARKPQGGFVFLTAQQLCLLWWAYRSRLIQLMDFRVWFAAQEMVARRCQIAAGQVPDYTPRELHGLVGGVGGEHLRASIRRLDTLGLLTWASTSLTFAASPTDLRRVHDLTGFQTMLQATTNPHRRVPVPRQAVRLIAGGLKASVIATMLGHLLRCLYYKNHSCVSGGWCKASWIAEVFRLDLRSIKAARKHLVAIGWLQILDTPQALCNRWGSYTRIRLSWSRVAMENQAKDTAHRPAGESPPLPDFCTTQLPPPDKEHREPLQELIHQKPTPQAHSHTPSQLPRHTEPASGGSSHGVHQQRKERINTSTTEAPTLRHLVPNDLQDTARLLILFEQAQTQGLIGKSESDRLTFVALAEHATVVGSTNPCGLFAALLHRQCWHFVTDSDEDAAQARLKHYLYGLSARAAPPPPSACPALSRDATIVRYVQTHLARAGWQGDVFGLVSREDVSWTRERWENAVHELEQAQRAWQQANVLNRLGDLTGLGEPLDALGAGVAAGDSCS
jgi:hypothetical protein